MVLWTISLVILAGAGYAGFFTYQLIALDKKINIYNSQPETFSGVIKSITTDSVKNLKGSQSGRINILLLGVAGKGKPGQNLTDTIMIVSIDMKEKRVALLSLPRDLYVDIPKLKLHSKINSVYQISLNNSRDEKEASDSIRKTVENITGLNIDYFVILNFDGFKEIIDSIGGLNITNERDIYDSRYPGPNYSYETFELKKGFHHLNGEMALKYARVRHGDPEGDFGRAKRQQQIMQAAKNKIFSAGTLFNFFAINRLMNALGDNIITNISTEDLEAFFELSRKLDTENINNIVIDAWNKDSLLKVSHIFYGNIRAFVLVPRVGNCSEIKETAENIFDLNIIKRKQEEIEKENASIVIINKSGNDNIAKKIPKLLSENLSFKNITVIRNDNTKQENENMTYAYDLTDGIKPFTLDELVKKLPAEASYKLPEKYKKIIEKSQPEIVVVLGKDLIERYNMEEGSIDEYRKAKDEFENINLIPNQ